MSKATQLAFNGGEFTEFMDARVDTAKYSKGCRTLENMNVLPYGAATARPGTKFGGEIHDSTKPTRLIPFVFSDTTTFHIEFSKDAIRFWKNGALIESSPGVPYVLEPYSDFYGDFLVEYSDVWLMQYEQINDVMYYTAPNQSLKKLVREADDVWRVETEGFNAGFFEKSPPMDYTNTDIGKTVELGVGADLPFGNRVTMTSNNFTFDDLSDAGNFIDSNEVFEFECEHEPEKKLQVSAGVNSEVIIFTDDSWSLVTEGTGNFSFKISTSTNGGFMYDEYASYDVKGTIRNYSVSGSVSRPTLVKITITSVTTVGSSAISISSSSAYQLGRAEVQDYVSPTEVEVIMYLPIPSNLVSTQLLKFRRQAFRKATGFATSVLLHKNRLCLAKNDIHLSVSGDYSNFNSSALADTAFVIPLRKSGSPLVKWMQDLRELRVGMTSDEVVVAQENVAEGFSYKNYYARFDSSYGSLPIKPEIVNGSLLFVTNDAETLRHQIITGIENYYDANTLTTLADHILQSGVVQTGFQRQPYPTYYAVREDGQLAVLLYEEAQNVQAWSRHVTDGMYKSVSVVPRPRGEDEVAYIIEREVDGVTKQYVEFRLPDMAKTLRDNVYSDMWFVDCGIEVEGSALTAVTGLDHLEGKEVAVLADGIAQNNKTVVAGEITLDAAADKVIVGLPYNYTLEPMMLNSSEVMGQSKQIAAAIVYLWRSGEGLVSVNGGADSRLKTSTDFTGVGLHDGTSGKINVDADWARETSITLKGSSPLPLNVQSITLEFDIGRK